MRTTELYLPFIYYFTQCNVSNKYLDMIKLAPMKTPMKLSLSDEDKLTLERWVNSRATGTKQMIMI